MSFEKAAFSLAFGIYIRVFGALPQSAYETRNLFHAFFVYLS